MLPPPAYLNKVLRENCCHLQLTWIRSSDSSSSSEESSCLISCIRLNMVLVVNNYLWVIWVFQWQQIAWFGRIRVSENWWNESYLTFNPFNSQQCIQQITFDSKSLFLKLVAAPNIKCCKDKIAFSKTMTKADNLV